MMVLSFFALSRLHAAEVFYLGGAAPDEAAGQMNPSYSLKQRLTDLLDFSGHGQKGSGRSGRISGTFSQTVTWQKVTGNESKSFLENGTDYNDEINLNIQEKLWRDYSLESQMFIRKTDDRRVEPRRDARMKQFNMKISNPRDLYEFGDFYGDFSPFTLSSSLEGFHADLRPSQAYAVQMVASRSASADVVADTFQRYVNGAKVDLNLLRSSEVFSNFRLGLQAVTSQDDSASLGRTSSTKDLRNTVIGVDGEFSLARFLSLTAEVARSTYVEDADTNAVLVKDQKYGTALRAQPVLNLGKTNVRYLYYYVQPGFYTDTGSAAADKIQHQVSLDHQLSPEAALSLMQNWYWDHLTGSSRTYRTLYNEKTASFTWRPFKGRTGFSFRPYVNYQEKDSDDLANTVEGVTRTLGFSVNDQLSDKTSYGASYEYRSYKDEAAGTGSDYFNRFGLNLSRESLFCGRRLYQSIGPSMDFRRTKRDSDQDVTVSTSWSGQYDVSKRLVSRFGYNLQVANNAGPAQNFLNNRNYLELDLLAHEKRGAHFIVRGERNHYDHENGDQDYDETRVTGRFTVNF
jgi:hypothetical protein